MWITFTAREKRLLLKALKQVSRVCDYANTEDSQGFNKPDAALGNSLARYPFLSDKQAFRAKKLLRKYRRQIDGWLYEAIYGEDEPEKQKGEADFATSPVSEATSDREVLT